MNYKGKYKKEICKCCKRVMGPWCERKRSKKYKGKICLECYYNERIGPPHMVDTSKLYTKVENADRSILIYNTGKVSVVDGDIRRNPCKVCDKLDGCFFKKRPCKYGRVDEKFVR